MFPFVHLPLLRLLISLVIVNLVYPLLPLVGPVNGLCVVVGDFSRLACLSDGISLLVDQSN